MFDNISIGDATIDTFIQIHDAQILCDINKKDCKLCLNYGEKIPVDKLVHMVAGNAANNAVGSKRLGLKTAIYVNIGSDSSAQEIIKKLKSEGVDSRYVIKNSEMESNFSAVVNFKGERTIFVYHQPWKYKLPELDRTKWVYLTSLSSSFVESNIVSEIIHYVQRTGAKLLYNPGTLQIKLGVKKTPQLLSLTESLIVNKEEAKKILGLKNDISIKKILKELADLGPKQVVITDGLDGSYGFDGEDKYYKIACFPCHFVEMTGAGDAYAVGVLGGLSYGHDLKEAMRWGAANGAAVTEHIGPQEGLLSFEQMQKRLKDNPKIIAKEI